jgi:DNA-binding MarR family transcriptional regulator
MQLLPEANNSVGVSECAHEVLDSVTPVSRFIRRQMCACRKDLSLPQFRTLVCVNQGPEASLSAVANFLGSSMPTASRIVAGLVQKGLLVRGACSDRRQVSLALTKQGRKVMEKAWSDAQTAIEMKLAGLDYKDREIVSNAMTLLKGLFGSAGLGPRMCCGREAKPGSHG